MRNENNTQSLEFSRDHIEKELAVPFVLEIADGLHVPIWVSVASHYKRYKVTVSTEPPEYE